MSETFERAVRHRSSFAQRQSCAATLRMPPSWNLEATG